MIQRRYELSEMQGALIDIRTEAGISKKWCFALSIIAAKCLLLD